MDSENLFTPDYCDIEYFKEIAEDYNDALHFQMQNYTFLL